MDMPPLEAEIDVDAPIDVVWGVISDLREMGDYSPETVRMFISDTPSVGSRGFNVNRRGLLWWPTTTRITQWKPPSHDGSAAVAFHVAPTNVEWSYELAPTDTGTRIVERRSAVISPSLPVRLIAEYVLGGQQAHDVELLDGMQRTLDGFKAEAERRS